MSRPNRRRLVIAPLLAASLVIAACGDDDDADDGAAATEAPAATAAPADTEAPAATEAPADTTAPAETQAPAATDAPATTEASDTTAAAAGDGDAAARVEAFSQPVTELPLSDPSPAEAGKRLFYAQCSVPVCAEIAIGIEAAAAAAGWEYETVSHQDTPDTVAAAFDAAIAAAPDVVMTSGNPREWFESQLDTLVDQEIPVVAWSLPEAYEPGDGIDVNLLTNDDYYFYGVLMADYLAVNSRSKELLFVGLPTFPVLSTVQQGFTDEIATACPDCNVKTIEVAITDIGTNLPGTVISELQANPDLDSIAYAFGGMLFGVPEALESAGLSEQAQAISQAGGPLNFGFIANGQHQVAEVALASELMGWRAVDAAIRILNGEGPGKAETRPEAVVDGHPDILVSGLPLQIVEADSIADPTALWPGVEGFQELFTELWTG